MLRWTSKLLIWLLGLRVCYQPRWEWLEGEPACGWKARVPFWRVRFAMPQRVNIDTICLELRARMLFSSISMLSPHLLCKLSKSRDSLNSSECVPQTCGITLPWNLLEMPHPKPTEGETPAEGLVICVLTTHDSMPHDSDAHWSWRITVIKHG